MKKLRFIICLALTGFAAAATPQYTLGSIGLDDSSHVQVVSTANGGTVLHSNLNTQYTIRLDSNGGNRNVSVGLNFNNFVDVALNDLADQVGKTMIMQDDFTTLYKQGSDVQYWIAVDGVKYDSSEFTYTVANGQITYTHAGSGVQFTVNAHEPGKIPTIGEPLPGIIACLMLGGGAAAFGLRRQKKA